MRQSIGRHGLVPHVCSQIRSLRWSRRLFVGWIWWYLRLSWPLLENLLELHGAALTEGIELLGVWRHVNSILKVLLVIWVGGGNGLEVGGLDLRLGDKSLRLGIDV